MVGEGCEIVNNGKINFVVMLESKIKFRLWLVVFIIGVW